MSECCDRCRALEIENAELRAAVVRLRSEAQGNISLRADLLEARLEMRRLQLNMDAQMGRGES